MGVEGLGFRVCRVFEFEQPCSNLLAYTLGGISWHGVHTPWLHVAVADFDAFYSLSRSKFPFGFETHEALPDAS